MTAPSHWLPITTTSDDPVTGAMVASFAEARDLLLATRDTEPYLLLVCADSTQCSVAEISLLVDAAIDTRCACFVVWGPGSPRVKLGFNFEQGRRLNEDRKVLHALSVFFDDEPLSAAIFFSLVANCAATCGTDWQLTSLPRRLLIIGSVATWDELLAAVDYDPPE